MNDINLYFNWSRPAYELDLIENEYDILSSKHSSFEINSIKQYKDSAIWIYDINLHFNRRTPDLEQDFNWEWIRNSKEMKWIIEFFWNQFSQTVGWDKRLLSTKMKKQLFYVQSFKNYFNLGTQK